MKLLVDQGIYSLTEQGIELLPVLAQMSAWGVKYLPVSEELGVRARLLHEGGPKMWNEFMAELRSVHLGQPARSKSKSGAGSVAARLRDAYEAAVARRDRGREKRPAVQATNKGTRKSIQTRKR